MTNIFIITLAAVLTGCQSLPTYQYCEHVVYTRSGDLIHVEADCHAPRGDIVNIPMTGGM